MGFLLAPIVGLFSGGGAAAGGAAAGAALTGGAAAAQTFGYAVPAAAAATKTGLTISSILQGVATVGGLVSSVAAGQADKDALDAQAAEADQQQPLENLQGINRRRSLKAAALEAIGETEAAYAGSGVDLSFGTAAQARGESLRELDLGLTSDSGTTMTRMSRLSERAANYRRMGKRALTMGWIGGLSNAAGSFAKMTSRV